MRGSRIALIGGIAVVLGALIGAGLAAATQRGSTQAAPAAQPTSPIAHLTGPSDLLLRWSFRGGLVTPAAQLAREPAFSLFGDGTVVFEAPPPTLPSPPPVSGSPAVPDLVAAKLSERGIQTVLRRAGAAGLFGPSRRFAGGPADAPVETFALSIGSFRRTVSFAGGTSASPPVASPGDAAARRAFADLGAKLSDIGSWIPSPDAGPRIAYAFARMAVYVGTPQQVRQGEATMTWPLRRSPAGLGKPSSTAGFRCAVVAGGDLDALARATRRASADARWRSGSVTYQVVFRPLLPDDRGC
jgi:hypothetical protein